MAVTLSRHLFTTRQQRFDVANGHVHIGGVLHILLHNAGDQLALLPGERAEHLVVLGLAEQLADDLTRGGCGQAAKVARGVIIFAQSRRRVRVILGRLDGDLILSPNGKASGKAHTSMLRRVRRFQDMPVAMLPRVRHPASRDRFPAQLRAGAFLPGPVPYFQDLLYEVIPSARPNGHSRLLV